MIAKRVIACVLLSTQILILSAVGVNLIWAQEATVSQTIKVSPTPTKTPTPAKKQVANTDQSKEPAEESDDLEIATFEIPQNGKSDEKKDDFPGKSPQVSSQEIKPEVKPEPSKSETPVGAEKDAAKKTETVSKSEPTDFVVDFEGSSQQPTVAMNDSENETDEEFSLEVDGNFVPGAKLFTQLLAENEEKERLEEERLAKMADANAGLKTGENNVNNQSLSYVKKTTIVTTTTSFGKGGNNSALPVYSMPSVNAMNVATQDAYRLVRLAAMGDGVPLPLEWAQHMVEAGKTHGIDPVLILEVCRQESRFRNNARSGANAHGLMQFIPGTAARFGINPYDPRQAIFGGAKYLRFLLDTFRGELRSALAGYNAGEGAVIAFATGKTLYGKNGKVINGRGIRTPFGIPPYAETQDYVNVIYSKYLASLNRLRAL